MKYVKHQPDLNWLVITPESEDDDYLLEHGIFKLVDHEIPDEAASPNKYKIIERLVLTSSTRTLNRFYYAVPIDAYEPDRPTIIDTTE